VGRKKVCSSPKHPHQLWGPPSILFNRYLGSFPDTQQLGCEVNNSPPSSVEVKNEWSYTSAAPIRLHGMNTENFTFYLYHGAVFLEKLTVIHPVNKYTPLEKHSG